MTEVPDVEESVLSDPIPSDDPSPPTELDAEPDAASARDLEASAAEARRAYGLGALIGFAIFLFVLTAGRSTLLAWHQSSDFYDAQAASLLEGRLDIDADRLGIEAFTNDGRAYMYQPPIPALLRLPVVAVAGDRWDGRLAGVSVLGAHLVLVLAGARILGAAWLAVGRGPTRGRLGHVPAAALGLVLAGGSVPVFLASRPWVYHEASMWGVAGAMVTVAACLHLARRWRWSGVAWAALGATIAMGSRASVGLGACALVAGMALLVAALPRSLHAPARRLVPAASLAVVSVVPVLGYAALNLAKFGSATSVPFEDQAFTALSPARQAMLAANDGTLFGLPFAPTTLLHYLRPTGLRLGGPFPFVDFPDAGGPVVGDVTFDLVDHTASITATQLALLLAGAIGTWLLVRRRVRLPLVWGGVLAAGAVGMATIVPFGYVAHRYTADALPLLVPAAALGVAHLGTLADRVRRPGRAAIVAGTAVAVCWAVWINVGLATVYQRLRAPSPPTPLVAELVEARLAIGPTPDVVVVATLPTDAPRDRLAVTGDCDGLYVWDGSPVGEFRTDAWLAVARTVAGGAVPVVVDADAVTGRITLVDAPGAAATAWIERGPDGVVVGVTSPSGEVRSDPQDADAAWALEVVVDPTLGTAEIVQAGEVLVRSGIPRAPGTDVVPAAGPLVSVGAGDDGALCRQARDEAATGT